MQYLAAAEKVIAAYGNNTSKGFISIIESECKEQDIHRANPPKLSFLRNQINATEMCAIFDPLAMDPSILDKEMVFSNMIEDIKTKINNYPDCFLRIGGNSWVQPLYVYLLASICNFWFGRCFYSHVPSSKFHVPTNFCPLKIFFQPSMNA